MLQDELASCEVQCQNCQTVFVAPEPNTAPQPVAQHDPLSSVFDQVPVSQPNAGFGYREPTTSPGNYRLKKTSSNKGLLIGGCIGGVVLLLCVIGVGSYYIWNAVSAPFTENLASESAAADDEFSEEIIGRYGDHRVVRLLINVTHQSHQSPQGFLLEKVKEPLKGNSTTVIRRLEGNEYEALIGPVDNLQLYSAKLNWLTSKSINPISRTISGSATLPQERAVALGQNSATVEQREIEAEQRRDELEKAAKKQLADQDRRRQERQLAKEEREENRAQEDAIRKADRVHQPRPGESIVDWLKRSIDGSFPYSDFDNLAKMEVQEEIRTEISGVLVEHLKADAFRSPTELKALLPALMAWRTDTSDQALIDLISSDMSRSHKRKYLLPVLEQIGTAKAAEALGTGLADVIYGDRTVESLIRMGDIAEKAALNWKKHDDAAVRNRVYKVLAQIGTRDSIEPLGENRQMEKDSRMKKIIRDAIKAIEARHPE